MKKMFGRLALLAGLGGALGSAGCDEPVKSESIATDVTHEAEPKTVGADVHQGRMDAERVRRALAINAESDMRELSAEEKEVVSLLNKLQQILESKYADQTRDGKEYKFYINTDHGGKLAAKVQFGGTVITINPGDKYLTTTSAGHNGILQIVPDLLREDILKLDSWQGRHKGSGDTKLDKWTESHNHPISFMFGGKGLAYGNYKMTNLEAVFSKFGLQPDTSGFEKADTILKALINQLGE